MADPINVVIDRIPLTNGGTFFEYFAGTLYCAGGGAKRINLNTNEVSDVGPSATSSFAVAAVDFHRPFPVPPDIAGSGAPDGRVYLSTLSDDFYGPGGFVSWDDFEAAELVPAMWDQVTQFKLSPQVASQYRPFVTAMAVSNSGRYLYSFDVTTLMVGVVDLEGGPRALGGYQLDHWSMGMVISPDDRFIYVAHPFHNFISVIDTTEWPQSVRKVKVVNNPFGLALSSDGKRLFVAQGGYGHGTDPGDLDTGTLTVLDTATMQGGWVYTGENSIAVAVNSTGTRAYVSNSNANTVSVVDVTSSSEVIDTITGLNDPGCLRLSADDKRLYVLDDSPSKGIAVVAV